MAHSLARSLHQASGQHSTQGKGYLGDPFKVALTLFDGYLAFQSAPKVNISDLEKQSPMHLIFVLLPRMLSRYKRHVSAFRNIFLFSENRSFSKTPKPVLPASFSYGRVNSPVLDLTNFPSEISLLTLLLSL